MENRRVYSGFDALIYILVIDVLFSFSPFFESDIQPFCIGVSFLMCELIACVSGIAARNGEGTVMGFVMPCFAILATVMAIARIVYFLSVSGEWGGLYAGKYFAFFVPVIVVLCSLWCVFSGLTTVYRCALLLLPIPLALVVLVVAAPFANGMGIAVTYFRSQNFLPEIILALKASLLMGFDIFAAFVAAPIGTLKTENPKLCGIKGITFGFLCVFAVNVCAKRYFYGSNVSDFAPFLRLLDTAYNTQFGTILFAFKTIALIIRTGLYFLAVQKAVSGIKTRILLHKSTNFSNGR